MCSGEVSTGGLNIVGRSRMERDGRFLPFPPSRRSFFPLTMVVSNGLRLLGSVPCWKLRDVNSEVGLHRRTSSYSSLFELVCCWERRTKARLDVLT